MIISTRCWKGTQLGMSKRQLHRLLAASLDLPLFVHCRAAFEDFVAFIDPFLPKLVRRGVVYSLVGLTSQMRRLVEMGGLRYQCQRSLLSPSQELRDGEGGFACEVADRDRSEVGCDSRYKRGCGAVSGKGKDVTAEQQEK